MLNKSLVGVEGTSDIGVGNDFRRIGLVRVQLTLELQLLQVQQQEEDNYMRLSLVLYQAHLLPMKK